MLVSAIKKKGHPKLLASLEFKEFRPCQEKSIKAGLFERKNILVCTPTASGKTLVAEMGAVNSILNKNGKAIYIVPLKSLASEKYREFKEKYEKLGIRVAISIGDLDSSDAWLENYDLIIATAEKLDSLLRHQARWVKDISTVVVDEVHLLNDKGRGPTLEIIITLLRQLLPKMQLIALSATVGNPKELATWMQAELVQDSWRPVKLSQGTFFNEFVDFHGKRNNHNITSEISDPTLQLAIDTIRSNQQALIFCPTKNAAESTALKIANLLKIDEDLRADAEKVIKSLGRPTKQCQKLYDVFMKTIAFHHAGLVAKQKRLVEDNFREGNIKIICCTPTLAMGINMPADRAIMKSLKRFDGSGSNWIPVLEYHQMTGRAGRPGRGIDEGLAISVAGSDQDQAMIYEKYILGEPESILSKLAAEPVLRTYMLSLIAAGFVKTKDDLMAFFRQTFYGFVYGDDWSFELKIEDLLMLLEKYGFITNKDDQLRPTQIGKRISELYLDPLDAWIIMKGFKKVATKNEFSLAQLISSTSEMRPLLSVRKTDAEMVDDALVVNKDLIITPIPKEWDWEYAYFLGSIKTALLFMEWMAEHSEEYLLETFNVRPGEIRSKLMTADWLLYACSEIARLLDLEDMRSLSNKTRIRVKHGIKEELLALIKLRGIGRYRARLLWNAGWKKPTDIKKSSPQKLAMILHSAKIADNVWTQLSNEKKPTHPDRDLDQDLDEF
ncbi:DEAD/DEAH box helicase [Candidatus Woesearchaeota archaeon]|nr:DEAD/DEAH box helicase [Candidatus Woesearchaeota archaeon]